MLTRRRSAVLIACVFGLGVPAASATQMPARERDYVAIVERARQDYASNQHRDGPRDIRVALQIATHNFAGLTHQIRGWVGILKQVKTVEDGKRAIVVEIAPGITISTWDNPFVDEGVGTLIAPAANVGRAVNTLAVEQAVTFDADLIGSVTGPDEAMIVSPRMIALFQKIAPAQHPAEQ